MKKWKPTSKDEIFWWILRTDRHHGGDRDRALCEHSGRPARPKALGDPATPSVFRFHRQKQEEVTSFTMASRELAGHSAAAAAAAAANCSRHNLNCQQLPVLDIRDYHEDKASFVDELRDACHNVGFFLLKHDLPRQLCRRQIDETRRFFEQPLANKMKISYEDNPSFRGYMPIGVENTAGRTDLREQVEYAVETPTGAAATSWPPYERLRSPSNPWPDSFQPDLRDVTQEYASRLCRDVADLLRRSLCSALGLDEDHLDPIFKSYDKDPPHWVLKLVSYPPVESVNSVLAPDQHDDQARDGTTTTTTEEEEGERFGVGAHTDTNLVTIILQDEIGGLQVWTKSGQWIDVIVPPPPPSDDDIGSGDCEIGNITGDSHLDYLVVNLGEQAEILSRGYFLATPHRVLANTHRHRGGRSKERISVPLFYNPSLSAVVEPIPNLPHDPASTCATGRPIDRDKQQEQEEEQGKQHWKAKGNVVFNSVGENTFKSLVRSHPRVFARHHGDLKLSKDGQIIIKAEADSDSASNVVD